MAIFNFSHCKKHCLQNKQTAIIPDMIEVSDVSKHHECVLELPSTLFTTLPLTLSTMSLFSVRSMSIFMIEVTLYRMLNNKCDHYCFALFMQDIDKALEEKKKEVNSKTVLDSKYWRHLNLFSKKLTDMLSLHCSDDYNISLIKEKQLPFCNLREMSQDKLLMLKKYLKENLIKGFIWVSSSSATTSILFVRKSKIELHLCVNYQELNNIIIKNHYQLSLIWETLNWLSTAKFFIKLNIIIVRVNTDVVHVTKHAKQELI